MIRRAVRLMITAGFGIALVSAPGCTIAADALNPSFFASLGFDPNFFVPPAGTVIVNFTNDTGFTATFNAIESRGGLDLTIDTRNFSVEVPANSARNEVLDCPVGLISPGIVDASFALDPTAAQVITGDTVVDVTYAWELLQGREFDCGDVIDIKLSGTGGAAATDFQITIRIIPGR